MARINMEDIVEALDTNFERTLTAVVKEAAPDADIDAKAVMRLFRRYLERGFDRWEQVPDRCVDAGW